MWPLDDTDLVWRIYNYFLRDHIPRKISVHNGVPTRAHARLLDPKDEFPEHEEALIRAIRNQANQGEDVVIVGGGLGISTVATACSVRPGGSVITYEASQSQVQNVKETVDLNQVSDIVTIKHGIVGPYSSFSEDKYGSTGDAPRIDTSKLPNCGSLVLDCEGAEVEIIREMEIRPKTIVVETHGFLGTDEESVRSALGENGYEVIDREVGWEPNGIYILTATLND